MYSENDFSEKRQLQERIRRIRDELTTRETRKRKSEDRAAQLQREVQQKNAELTELSVKLESVRLRLAALKGEEVRFREKEYAPFDRAAARVDPREALLATKKRLDELQILLDRSTAQKDLPTFVDVHFNAYKCSFALSNKTTFDSLREEASFHWGVTIPTVLKNANDEEYRGSAIVQTTLAEERRTLGIAPYVRLHMNIGGQQMAASPERFESSTSSSRKSVRPTEARNNNLLTTPSLGNAAVFGDDTSESVSSRSEGLQMRDYIRQKEREAWQAAVMRQSVFFHDDEYSAKVDPIREPQLPKARQRYIQMILARSCLWLAFWAVTAGLTIAAMIFRFDTSTAYTAVKDVNEVLGAQPFCLPLDRSTPDDVFSATIYLTPTERLYRSSCGDNQIVRRFGGFSRASQDDVFGPVPPSERILTLREVEHWIQQVLLPALNLGTSERQELPKLVSAQSVLLGNAVSISFAAVKEQQCSGFFYRNSMLRPCFKAYTPLALVTSCPEPFTFSPNTHLAKFQGRIQTLYFAEGCTVQINRADWSQGEWLTPNVRVVLFEFNLLNLNLGWVSQVKVGVELGPARLLITSLETNVIPLSVYEAYSPRNRPLVIVADALLVLYALVSVFYWIIRPKLLGIATSLIRPLATVWNLIALLLLLVALAQIGLGMGYELSIAKTINLNAPTFFVQDLSSQSTAFSAYLGLSCVSLFLLLLSVFKHIQGDPKISLLFQTVHRSARMFGALGFFFVLALASMSVWANLAWGSYIFEWTSIDRCVALLCGMVFGAPIDFAAIRETQNTQMWIAFFYVIFVFFIILILVQFFAAIMLDAFLEIEAVTQERRRSGGPEQVFGLNLLLSPATWLREPRSAKTKTKKASKGFSTWLKIQWIRLRRGFSFSSNRA